MAVIYFTNNADSGAGSLRAAITSAQSGDIIRPDESVFERGETIEITPASSVSIDKSVTLDASPFRVRLNLQDTDFYGPVRIEGLNLFDADNVSVEIVNFDIVDRVAKTDGAVNISMRVKCSLKNCLIAGHNGSGLFVNFDSEVVLENCVITGCSSDFGDCGIYTLSNITISNSTVTGNRDQAGQAFYGYGSTVTLCNSIVAGGFTNSGGTIINKNSIRGSKNSEIGFVAPPPDSIAAADWTSELWKSWDLHLLDDGSDAPSPCRDAGDVEHMSRYDIEGNFRGREVDGVATCSPGAYETIQADLFWIGKDATGAAVEKLSFAVSDGWATSRFATVSDGVVPETVGSVFIGLDAALSGYYDGFEEGSSLNVVVGGGRTISGGDSFAFASLNTLTAGANAFFPGGFSLSCNGFRFGAGVRCEYCLDVDVSSGVTNYSDADGYIEFVRFYGDAVPSDAFCLEGCFSGYSFDFSQCECSPIKSAPGVVIYANDICLPKSANNGQLFTNLVEARPYEDWLNVNANNADAGNESVSFEDNFIVDISGDSDARVNLRLTGQAARGHLPNGTLFLGGSARIVGAKVNVARLEITDFTDIVFGGDDAILAASAYALVYGMSAYGVGYFAAPSGTGIPATFAETVRVLDYSAGVEEFSVATVGRQATFVWTAKNVDAKVVVEQFVDAEWKVVGVASGGEIVANIAGSGDATFRIFDGDKFLTTSIYVPALHAWLTYDNLFTSAVVVKSYKVVTEFILMSVYFNANEAPIFLARIEDSATSIPVAPEQVESIGLTAYALRLSRGVKKRVPLDGWVDVEVPTTAIQAELVATDPRWKQDSIGYNFLFEPDLREKQLFSQAGEYAVVISVKFKDGNPAPLVFEVAVK